jgi:acetolactate synthase-1/2/3 large subunit
MERTPTGADVVGRVLRAAGATHAFGIPGGEVLALMQGLAGAGIAFALVRHENSGGFMAEGLWHATGALPVLVATLGPGVANAVNVVANALQDRVPLIVLTGCIDAAEAESYTHQVFDHQALLRPVTKASLRLAPGAVALGIARAVALARDGQPGPVHVDVPIGVAEAPAAEPPVAPMPPARPGAPPAAALRAARAALADARRPLAIAGVDAVNEGAGPALAAFCRSHAIPLVTTYKGKGLMAEDEPLCLGAAGLSPLADRILLPLVGNADVVLLAGYDPIEMRIGWRDPWGPRTLSIDIAPVPRRHGMHRIDHALLGGLAETLAALAHAPPPGRWTDGAPAAARAALRRAFAGPAAWGPHAVFRTLQDVLPPDAVLTADSGAHRILLSQMWQCRAPRGLLQSAALCTMACALPLAAGVSLGRPGRPVVAVLGDGGLEMGAGELATLRDLRLPVILIVLADRSLALIEMKQRAAQRPNLGVDFGATDHVALARAFGGHGAAVSDAAGLAAELRAALDRDRFTLIAAQIGSRAYDGAI